MSKLIDGKNSFNEKSLNEMIEELEKGETIEIYIDCIGNSRTEIETYRYVHALKKIYGDRLTTKSRFGKYDEILKLKPERK